MSINILAFDGDGIGPEIMKSTLNIVELLNLTHLVEDSVEL